MAAQRLTGNQIPTSKKDTTMNHQWQQPIRPLEIQPNVGGPGSGWFPVLFIRPTTDGGWEVITTGGATWNDGNSMIRRATL